MAREFNSCVACGSKLVPSLVVPSIRWQQLEQSVTSVVRVCYNLSAGHRDPPGTPAPFCWCGGRLLPPSVDTSCWGQSSCQCSWSGYTQRCACRSCSILEATFRLLSLQRSCRLVLWYFAMLTINIRSTGLCRKQFVYNERALRYRESLAINTAAYTIPSHQEKYLWFKDTISDSLPEIISLIAHKLPQIASDFHIN